MAVFWGLSGQRLLFICPETATDFYFFVDSDCFLFLLIRQKLSFYFSTNSAFLFLYRQQPFLFLNRQQPFFISLQTMVVFFCFPQTTPVLYFWPYYGSFLFLPRQVLFLITSQTYISLQITAGLFLNRHYRSRGN